MKIKEGYEKVTDPITGTIHLYPKEGRKHYFDKCWCKPRKNKKLGIISHYYIKENSVECKNK